MNNISKILKLASSILMLIAIGFFAYGGLLIFQTCKEDDGLIVVKNETDLVGTWIIEGTIFVFTEDGYFDIISIGMDNLNNLNKVSDIKYYISNETLYTKSPNENPIRRGWPAYMNNDKNMLYLYDLTDKPHYKIDMNEVLTEWSRVFVKVTNASQIIGSWTNTGILDTIRYSFYDNGTCDFQGDRKKYTVDNGNIHIFLNENDDGGNRVVFLSQDGNILYFNLKTNSPYFREK